MKKLVALWGLITSAVVFVFVLAILTTLLGALGYKANQDDSSSSSSGSNTTYAKHWSTGDPYTHNLLTHRYGIKEEQLDSYLKSTGIAYDPDRINGAKLLQWERSSNLDVRAIIAIATAESSLGTAGVATEPGANMFGYGAFDSDPNHATAFNDEKAIDGVASVTIILNKNESFKIQDDKAKALADGSWTPLMGGVYFTDTSGTGKRRADIMANVDKWIDAHGGTPDAPNGGDSGSSGGAIQSLTPFLGTVVPNTYGGAEHQCYDVSSYYAHAFNNAIFLNHGEAAADIGSDYNWSAWHWTVVNQPKYDDIKPGDIINFKRGANMGSWVTDPQYGHTAVVSQTLGNNKFSIYEQGTIVFSLNNYTYQDNMISSIIHPPK